MAKKQSKRVTTKAKVVKPESPKGMTRSGIPFTVLNDGRRPELPQAIGMTITQAVIRAKDKRVGAVYFSCCGRGIELEFELPDGKRMAYSMDALDIWEAVQEAHEAAGTFIGGGGDAKKK